MNTLRCNMYVPVASCERAAATQVREAMYPTVGLVQVIGTVAVHVHPHTCDTLQVKASVHRSHPQGLC